MSRNTDSVQRVILGKGFAISATENDFDHIVNTSSVPVLVDFWAEWCPPCAYQGPILDEFASEYPDDIKVVKVEIDKAPLLQDRFEIINIPTIMVFVDGKPVKTLIGARDLEVLTKDLKGYITK